VLAVCLVGLLLGGGMIAFGAMAAVHQRRLQTHGARITARVTEARSPRDDGASDPFEVRYAFELPDRPRTFTQEDELGRSNLWARTEGREQWRAAVETGRIEVLYLPESPGINRLAGGHGMPLADNAAVIVLGLLVAGVSLRIGWLEATGQGAKWRSFVDQIDAAMRPKSRGTLT